VRLEGLSKLKKKSNDVIGNRTRYLPACSMVIQPTKLPRNEYYEFFWGGGKGRQERKADNRTAICEPIVCIM
jgi:hypothetical protein